MKGSSARRSKNSAAGVGGLKRLIQKVERNLNAKIDRLRSDLEASETALAATRLREMNDRQTGEGVSRLHQDLKSQHEAGIIDRKGNRLRPLPGEGDPASDIV
jgi:hypothetical protein